MYRYLPNEGDTIVDVGAGERDFPTPHHDKDAAKLHLLREFDPECHPDDADVPDPWYGGANGFVHVYDLMEAACRGLLEHLR